MDFKLNTILILLLLFQNTNSRTFSSLNDIVNIITNMSKVKGLFENPINFDELIKAIAEFIEENSNYKIIVEEVVGDCLVEVFNYANDISKLENILLAFSGKGPNQIGGRSQCEAYREKYLLFDYKINPMSYYKNKKLQDAYMFQMPLRYFTGICLPSSCDNLYKRFFSKEENELFFQYLFSIGVDSFKTVVIEDEYYPSQESAFEIISIIISVYFIFGVLFTIVSEITVYCYNRAHKNKLEKNHSNNDESIYTDNLNILGNYTSITISPPILKQKDNSLVKLMKRLSKYFSFIRVLNNLFSMKNKYYNSTDLTFLSLIRFVSLLMITIYFSFEIMLKLPQKDSSLDYIFEDLSFIIVKLSIFWIDVFILIEGIFLGYRLLKDIQDFEFKLNLIFKVAAKLYTRMISFVFIYVFLYMLILSLGQFFNSSDLLLYFVKILYDNQLCYTSPSSVFYTFYLQYFNKGSYYDNDDQDKYSKCNSYQLFSCFTFFQIAFNLFVSIMFQTFIVYISMKIKRVWFDAVVFTLNILNIVGIFLYFMLYDKIDTFPENLNISIVLGEKLTYYNTHLFFSLFHIGFNIGVIIFYYNDIVTNTILYSNMLSSSKRKRSLKSNMTNETSETSLVSRITLIKNGYLPYFHCFKTMMYLSKLSKIKWKLIFILSFLCLLVTSLSSYIIYKVNDNNLSVPINFWIRLIYLYEKKVFILGMSCLILSIYLYPKKESKSYDNKLLLIFERISFNYLCAIQSFTVLFFNIFNVDYRLKLVNILYFSISILFVCSLFSILITTAFEYPLRVYFKESKRRRSK